MLSGPYIAALAKEYAQSRPFPCHNRGLLSETELTTMLSLGHAESIEFSTLCWIAFTHCHPRFSRRRFELLNQTV